MKIIRNKLLPPKGYRAITLGPYIFIRKGTVLGTVDINHESIHWEQEREMLILPFFLWYTVEFLIKYGYYHFKWKKAYRAISFEREAYSNQNDMGYLKTRKPLEWLDYLIIKNK